MSHVRWGVDGSDVYVYDDVNGKVACCGCLLGGASRYFVTHAELALHLREHEAAGHQVPAWVYDDLVGCEFDNATPPTTVKEEAK